MALRRTLPMGALRTQIRRPEMGSPTLSSHCHVRAFLQGRSVSSSLRTEYFNRTFSFHFQSEDVFGGRSNSVSQNGLNCKGVMGSHG